MTNQEKYEHFCHEHPEMPVFLKPWWLSAVYGENWDALFYEEKDRTLAAMPYFVHRKYGFRSIIPPKLTPTCGLWIAYPENQKPTNRYALEIKAMEHFAQQIDALHPALFQTTLHHSLSSWLGFLWNGFSQTTRYTYRFTHLQDLNFTFSQIDTAIRTRIRKIEKEGFVVRTDLSREEIYRVNALTYTRQGMKCPFSFEEFERIDLAAEKRGVARHYAILDSKERVHSVDYVIVDGDVWQALFSGSDPELRSSNAASLLLWHVLQDASHAGATEYNFNGSVMRPIETFIRHFGAEQTPYLVIEKRYSKVYNLLRGLRE